VAAAIGVAFYTANLRPDKLGYAYLARAASGIYANANTFHASLQAVFGSTMLGGQVGACRQLELMPILGCQSSPS
jgi:hypothetical protein